MLTIRAVGTAQSDLLKQGKAHIHHSSTTSPPCQIGPTVLRDSNVGLQFWTKAPWSDRYGLVANRQCGFRSSLRDAIKRFTMRDALERFTESTTARPCGPRPGMYISDVLHLILACFCPCSCFCDLFCTCCCPNPFNPSMPLLT